MIETKSGGYYLGGLVDESINKTYASSYIIERFSPETQEVIDEIFLEVVEKFDSIKKVFFRVGSKIALRKEYNPIISYLILDSNYSTSSKIEYDLDIYKAVTENDFVYIKKWLSRALEEGNRSLEKEEDPEIIYGLSKNIINNKDSLSWIVNYNGERIGHATVLVNQEDEVLSNRYTDIFDILIDHSDANIRRCATQKLVEILRYEFKDSIIMGNVVHEKSSNHAETVLKKLTENGWNFFYTLYEREKL